MIKQKGYFDRKRFSQVGTSGSGSSIIKGYRKCLSGTYRILDQVYNNKESTYIKQYVSFLPQFPDCSLNRWGLDIMLVGHSSYERFHLAQGLPTLCVSGVRRVRGIFTFGEVNIPVPFVSATGRCAMCATSARSPRPGPGTAARYAGLS